jgi:hypothetical protein
VAEVEYTAFTAHQNRGRAPVPLTARLIVRRVRDMNTGAGDGQEELFPAWRCHAVFTDSPFEMIQAEGHHRDYLLTELRDVAAAQKARWPRPSAPTPTGLSCPASRSGLDPGAGATESGHPALNGSPVFSSMPLVDTRPDVRASALACDDARTLEFTLIVQ